MYPLVRELAEDGIPVSVTCRVLKIARQPYYRWLAQPVTDAELVEAYRANALFDAYDDDPEFGYRFLVDEARDAGQAMAERTAWRICSANGWWSVFGKPKKGKAKKPGPPVHDDLCAFVDTHGVTRHEFNAEGPNQLWVGDITEHWTGEGKLYMCAYAWIGLVGARTGGRADTASRVNGESATLVAMARVRSNAEPRVRARASKSASPRLTRTRATTTATWSASICPAMERSPARGHRAMPRLWRTAPHSQRTRRTPATQLLTPPAHRALTHPPGAGSGGAAGRVTAATRQAPSRPAARKAAAVSTDTRVAVANPDANASTTAGPSSPSRPVVPWPGCRR